MNIPEPKYRPGDIIVAPNRSRAEVFKAYTEFEGRVISLRYIAVEDDEPVGEWEYEIRFQMGNAQECVFRRESVVDEGISYE